MDGLLDWFGDQPGNTWQQRWLATGAEQAGRAWRNLSAASLSEHGHEAPWRVSAVTGALVVAVCADLIRPRLSWLIANAAKLHYLSTGMARSRDVDGFARLTALCEAEAGISAATKGLVLSRASLILAAKGGRLADITAADVLELLDVETTVHVNRAGDTAVFYRMLHTLGALGEHAPESLRQLRSLGQRTPDQLIDRYNIACRPVRDLLVDYLRERQPALDYTSLESLANFLGKLFWADLEKHHPGINSLRLTAEVSAAWKLRLRTMTSIATDTNGQQIEESVTRINYRECLTPVRAFYLDLAHWAVEDPARWAYWVVPCPVGIEEINRRKSKRHRKARMDARTRERLPVLPALVRSVNQRRQATSELLAAARNTAPGDTFTAAGQTFTRSIALHSSPEKTWADDPDTGKRRDLGREEDKAFWAWAAVEVLRATGVRVEELLELSHHSLVQYRLPTTGELIPLLQIVPSKTDTERLLVVSPELADVLSTIITRVRDKSGAIPLLSAYDPKERTWSQPAPLLFQRHYQAEDRPIPGMGIRDLLKMALEHTSLTDPTTGEPLRFTPHDFRRMFITDAVLNGLPPHIAQVIAGHRDINVTLGYKAVYPHEAIQAHLAFLARRRSLRPSEEYRVPTDEEWEEFLGHFQKRKVSVGTCGRAFETPCIHEHACVRCSMLWPDPDQRPRLAEIRDNLADRVTEAKREGWLGEVEGLEISLAGAEQKLAQIDQRPQNGAIVNLGMPTVLDASDHGTIVAQPPRGS
ncbi:site-specific integrase [Cryobacterium sp. PH31-AA6]|uniref:site-specific integrase n=1 Tax=Cryobacterium sp. PH31-AA6 TaxID=3046205 RepID=UPI0024BAAFCF|nr:site-specific integrase [Cryobacterium sp. PH31-AA6]MDJ0325193.1 site-specific integrase [Cryobacterium sp. PH31-AA6]